VIGARPRIEVKQTRIKEGKELRYAVLCRDDTGVPLAVAGRYGFGRVTLIGIDLTSPQMIRMGLPSGRFNVWHDVFGWRSEAIPWTQLEEYAKDSRLYRPEYRDQKPIDGELIDRVIDMQETVGPLLLGASALFAIYWGLACPGSWFLLRRQKLEQHSWVVFTGIACVFVAIAWLAALFARPAEARAAHYSVVDLDDKTGQVRVLSWATVFVPEHGKVRLDVDAGGKAASANGPSGTITAIGSLEDAGDSGFLDSQSYEVDAAAPSAMDVPFRGTAKRVQIDWRGPVESLAWPAAPAPAAPATTAPATQPTQPAAVVRSNSHGIHGKIKRKADLLEGVLTHDLPGDLEEVRLIYPAADGGEPWVSAVPRWRPGQPLDLRAVTSALSDTGRAARQRLAIRAANSDENWTGYLGDLLRYAPGTTLDPATGRRLDIAPTSLVQAAQLLTFFDNLPPPRSISSKTTSVFNTEKERGISRGPGRALEMSQALRIGRVIVIGQVADAPMLAPLHADGRALPNKGWTFVRWVGELESTEK